MSFLSSILNPFGIFGGSGNRSYASAGPYENKVAALGKQNVAYYKKYIEPVEKKRIKERLIYSQPWFYKQQLNRSLDAQRAASRGYVAAAGSGLDIGRNIVAGADRNSASTAATIGLSGLNTREQGIKYNAGLVQTGENIANSTAGGYSGLSADELGERESRANYLNSWNGGLRSLVGEGVSVPLYSWLDTPNKTRKPATEFGAI